MVDRLENTSIQDLAFAKAADIDIKEVEKLDLFQQKNKMQNLAFKMQNNKEIISQDEADKLNYKYQEIISLLENEYDTDLMCDYWINFNSFVPDNPHFNRFSY
jgi:hypothetical protein